MKGRRMAEQWFVVRTKPSKETTASVAIASEGFPAFMPVQIVERSHAGKRERVSRPLFPRYIFVQFDRENPGFGKLNYCRGVANKGLMCDAMDRPVSVPDAVITEIRDRERLSMAIAGETKTGFRPGDTFPIQRGSYTQITMTYMGEDKGEVWGTIELFGRPHVVHIPFEAVPQSGGNSIDKISA
jgi:transcriptional antiterminator RfaH